MRDRLESLIDKYNKKMLLEVSNDTRRYYQSKIEAYEHSLRLLDEYKEVI